ncbi:7722_t:CDS:2, partial [Ambispora gerdemannii]
SVEDGSSKKRKHPEVTSETIGRLLPIIVNLCPQRDVPDFITIYRPNGTVIELGYSVKKIFKEEASVKHLVEIYETLRENKVRYTDKLEHSTSHCVYLAPRGLQRTPTNLKELLQA